MVDIWFSEEYKRHAILLVIHRFSALVYYLTTYRSCIEFMSPKYVDKAAWVSIAQERFNLYPMNQNVEELSNF